MSGYNDKRFFNDRAFVKAPTDTYTNTKSIHLGVVTSVEDDLGAYRIKARIKGIDDGILNNNDLPYCYPLLPKNNNILPKPNELVRILLSDVSTPFNDRLYVGYVTTQVQNIKGQPYEYSKLQFSEESYHVLTKKTSINNIPLTDGIYPKPHDVAYLGRDNSDVWLKDREAILRAGRHIADDNTKANFTNPAYFQSYLQQDGTQSYANIVADNINFISHQGTKRLKSAPLLDEDTMQEAVDSLHPVAYGDILATFLELMRDVLCNDHSHPYNGVESIKTDKVKKLLEFDLSALYSKKVKCN